MAVSKADLDARLKAVALMVRNTVNDGESPAALLAAWLATIPQATLEGTGYGYTAEDAYAIKLFGDSLAAFTGFWETGTALPAMSPTLAVQARRFTGLD